MMARIETDIEKYREMLPESEFTGTMLELLAINLGTWFLSCITVGIATPWLECWATKWKTEHTFINGKQMKFDGVGSQLFFEYIKWWLLGVVTLGIYGLWIPVKLEKWMVQHIYFEDSSDRKSDFTGGVLAYWGIELATFCLTILSLGIAYPWLMSWQVSWYRSHTCISGEQLHFDGRGIQLFGKWIQWFVLMILTLGIYGLWLPVKEQQWIVKHTYIGYNPPMSGDAPGPFERFWNWISGKKPIQDGWKCDHCGHKNNPKGSSFCVECGQPKVEEPTVVPALCPKCGRLKTECTCGGGLWKKCPGCGKMYKGDKCADCEAPRFFMCARCGRNPVTVRGGICTACGSKKKCENCGNLYAGTKCPYCRANPMCSRCGKRPVTMEGEICDSCEKGIGFFRPTDLD